MTPTAPHEILVDTAALLAILDQSDAKHLTAASFWQALLGQRTTLITSSYVTLETAVLAQARLGHQAARAFHTEVVPVLDVAWVESDLHSRGLEAWAIDGRRHLSLVDCVSFALMRELRLDTAFTFDRHFIDAGFAILP